MITGCHHIITIYYIYPGASVNALCLIVFKCSRLYLLTPRNKGNILFEVCVWGGGWGERKNCLKKKIVSIACKPYDVCRFKLPNPQKL